MMISARGRHFEVVHAAAGEPVGFAEQAADDLELPHLRRVGVDHRAHIVQRVDAERDDRRQRFTPFFGAAVEFVQATARMQRHAEPVLALQHQAVKAGGVDAGHGVAGDDLAGGDVGRRIHRELQRDRQFCQVDIVPLDDHVLPCAALHGLAGNVFLAALAKCRGEVPGVHAEAGSQKLAVAGDVGDQLHAAAAHVLEHHHGAFPRLIEFEHQRRRFETQIDRLADPQQFVRILGFNQPQEAAQALAVEIYISSHGCPLGVGLWSR